MFSLTQMCVIGHETPSKTKLLCVIMFAALFSLLHHHGWSGSRVKFSCTKTPG